MSKARRKGAEQDHGQHYPHPGEDGVHDDYSCQRKGMACLLIGLLSPCGNVYSRVDLKPTDFGFGVGHYVWVLIACAGLVFHLVSH